MSYCFNPACECPQNLANAQFCQSCGSNLVLHPNDEEISAVSRYRGLKLIGQGGFGRTVLAVDESQPLQPQFVIKQLFPQSSNYATRLAQFRQEAQQLQRLGQHSQIPVGFSHFEHQGYFYLVQEFIEGQNLAQELLKKGIFNELKIRQLLKDLLPVLDYIHHHHVIHRDIKPENIIRRRGSRFNQEGSLVLVDFGAAKLVQERHLPKTETVIGSAAFTAPEQLMGKAVFASDIYSLGVTCIHLLTGISPFDLFDSREGHWVWRDYLKSPVSPELGQVLDKMLQGATNHRYHSAQAVLRQLQPRPVYVGAFPALNRTSEISLHSEQEIDSNPEIITEELIEPTVPFSATKIPRNSIQEQLQQAVFKYPVQLQVNWIKKNQLIVVINRLENDSVNYVNIARLIRQELSKMQLKTLQRVKLLGRVQGHTVPEWKMVLRVGYKTRLKKKIEAVQAHPFYQHFKQLQSQSFWREKLQDRGFILDVLMASMIGFIFCFKLAIIHPILGLFIALGFLKTKHQIAQHRELAINPLFGTVTTLFIVLGASNWRLIHQDFYSIIMAGLFLSLPLVYSKAD